jgi:hypothetical protein
VRAAQSDALFGIWKLISWQAGGAAQIDAWVHRQIPRRGNDLITTVDVSWNKDWNGTEQRRHFTFEGDRLLIDGEPGPSIVFPGKTDYRRLVWERDTQRGAARQSAVGAG